MNTDNTQAPTPAGVPGLEVTELDHMPAEFGEDGAGDEAKPQRGMTIDDVDFDTPPPGTIPTGV